MVRPEKDIWSLFVGTTCPCTNEAVIFLMTCLKHLDFHENYVPNNVIAKAGLTTKYPLRCQLVDWMLPNKDEIEEPAGQKKHSEAEPQNIAAVLSCLIVRDTHQIPAVDQWSCTNVLDDEQLHLRYIQSVYLKTSFQESLLDTYVPSVARTVDSSCLVFVKKYICDLIECECLQGLDQNDMDVCTSFKQIIMSLPFVVLHAVDLDYKLLLFVKFSTRKVGHTFIDCLIIDIPDSINRKIMCTWW